MHEATRPEQAGHDCVNANVQPLDPFRLSFVAVPDRNAVVLAQATLSDTCDVTIFRRRGTIEVFWVDMDSERAETTTHCSLDEAKAFAAERYGVRPELWS